MMQADHQHRAGTNVEKGQAEQMMEQAEHPISLPMASSETFARIGIVAEGVGPKKLKTGEFQQPRPVVEPLLGVVRGVGGIIEAREKDVKSIEKSVKERGEICVNTHTGSVRVAFYFLLSCTHWGKYSDQMIFKQ